MRCPYCGEQNPDTARRCSRCGRRLDKVRVKKRERQLLLMGIILILVILAGGIGAMFGISKFLQDGKNSSPQKVTIKSTPTPETESVSGSSSTSVSSSSEPSATPAAEEEKVTASIVDSSRQAQIDLLGYSQVTVASADATSTIYQAGIDNTPHVLYDGSKDSSWQDGVDGPGIGESVTYHLDQVYKIKFLVVRLGNWYGSDDNYTLNNRPKTMTFKIGDQSVSVTFPDEKREFCVELSKDVKASEIQMIIDAVYSGSAYDDTCINEVDVYGVPTGEAAAEAGTDSGTAAGTGTQSAGASGTNGTAGTAGSGTTGITGTDGTGSAGTGDTAGGTGTYGADTYGGTGTYGADAYGGTGGSAYGSGDAYGTYDSGYGADNGYGNGTYGGTANYGQTDNSGGQ